jgi:hypothetical protein
MLHLCGKDMQILCLTTEQILDASDSFCNKLVKVVGSFSLLDPVGSP